MHDDDGAPRICAEPFPLEPLLALDRFPECGGLASFVGTVRDHHQGRSVQALRYTAHGPVCEKLIREIEAETRERYGLPYLQVRHRVGRLAIGDVAIVCVARAAHRAEAFAACRHAVDEVKHRAPIWKEEFYTDGSSAFVEGCCIRQDDGHAHNEHGHGPHGHAGTVDRQTTT